MLLGDANVNGPGRDVLTPAPSAPSVHDAAVSDRTIMTLNWRELRMKLRIVEMRGKVVEKRRRRDSGYAN